MTPRWPVRPPAASSPSWNERAVFAAAILAVGVAGAAFAIVFRLGLRAGFIALLGREDVLAAFGGLPRALRVLFPVLGGAAAGIVTTLAARQPGYGVGEVLEAVTVGRGQLPLAACLWKSAASFLAIVTGGSLGREGSIIQFGAGAGAAVGRRLGLTAPRARALVAVGTGAGFAAAYNTPLAAVLFVVEVVLGVATLGVVLPVVVGVVVATGLTRAALGGGPLYGARDFALSSPRELVAHLALGLAAGVLGPAFLVAIARGENTFARLSDSRPARGALGGLGVGLLATGLPAVTGNGFEAIHLILDARLAVGMLAILLAAKALATVSSVGSGSPGGVFTPTLFLGAALGGLVGQAAHALPGVFGHAVVPEGYALVGMAALTAATTHAPLMACALAFELSGDYAIVLPLMLATAVATTVSRQLRPSSVYTDELRRRGVAWEGSVTERLARAVRARDILEFDPPTVAADAPVERALSLLREGRARRVYVLDGATIRAIDLNVARDLWADAAAGSDRAAGRTAGSFATAVPVAAVDDTLFDLNEKLWSVDFGEIPVRSPADPATVLGVVTRRALLGAFDRELLQRDMLLTRVVWSEGERERADYLELPQGQRVEVVAPPAHLLGTRVSVGALRARYRVTLVGVQQGARDGATWHDPDDATALRRGDRLLVIGDPSHINCLRKDVP
jgi:CIC family chloride channel protein